MFNAFNDQTDNKRKIKNNKSQTNYYFLLLNFEFTLHIFSYSSLLYTWSAGIEFR
jgi:hypothetical protein